MSRLILVLTEHLSENIGAEGEGRGRRLQQGRDPQLRQRLRQGRGLKEQQGEKAEPGMAPPARAQLPHQKAQDPGVEQREPAEQKGRSRPQPSHPLKQGFPSFPTIS